MPSWEPTALLEALDESVGVFTRDGVFVYANPASARMMGKPVEVMLGSRMWELWPEVAGSDFYHAFHRVAATGIAEQTEAYFQPWDRWFRGRIVLIGDHVHVVSSDITEQKRGENRLLVLSRASHAFAHAVEREPLFETIAHTLAELVGDACIVRVLDNGGLRPVAVRHADPDLELRLVEFFRKPLGETEGVSIKVLESGEPLLIERLDLVALRDTFNDDDHKNQIRPGTIHSVMANALRNGDTNVGVVTLLRDRTQRPYTQSDLSLLQDLTDRASMAVSRASLYEQERTTSAALAETNATLNAMIHASPAAIVMTDMQGMIRLWNPAAERMFGWTAAEMLGQRWPTLDTAQANEVLENFAQLARGQEISGREMRRPRRDGTMIDVAMWAAPVVRTDGLTHGLALFVDITDRRVAELAARTADQRKDEFLAMLGHELRNPLAPILTVLELMRMRGETVAVDERALIERQTRHLVRLVDDLLDIARITRGKVELRKHRVDLGVAIAQAVEMASPLLELRNHHVSVAAPRGLAFIDGDEFRIAQVFQNLLTNAAKYTPSGGSITVRMSVRGHQAFADVEDDGVGITTDVLPTIFDAFVQGAQKLDRSQGGLGIGLTLVRSLVEMHGGSIAAHSAGPGQGSRFTVQLPLSLTTGREAQGTPPGMVPLRHTQRRVLLVDDNRDAAEMLAELLRTAGHEVVVAFDGPSALGVLPAFKPDVALLDIGLPVMDGYDLARKLKRALTTPPRLIAITGYGQEHDHRRSHEAGFDAHLVKPVQAAQVLAAVDEPTT